jgi:hypothetical protein
MNATTYHSLVKATVASGSSVMEKSASASPDQNAVLSAAWPDGSQTKMASLACMLATGMLVEEAEASSR